MKVLLIGLSWAHLDISNDDLFQYSWVVEAIALQELLTLELALFDYYYYTFDWFDFR